jgi:hypothetical protein
MQRPSRHERPGLPSVALSDLQLRFRYRSTVSKSKRPVQQNAETAFLQDVNYKISVLWRIIDQVGFLVKFIATWVIEII